MPLFLSSGVGFGDRDLLRLLFLLFDPLWDLVVLLLLCRSADLQDKRVLVGACCASTSDLSVMSSILGAVSVCPN